jgi:hypothetical protein
MTLKVVGILLVGLLMATIIPVGSDSIQTIDKQANEDLEYLYPEMSEPITIQLPTEYEEYPTMPPIPIDVSCREPNFFNINRINTPEEFNWKNIDGKDWTTPAKNQGHCGSCWLFSAMGALESVINIREGCAELDPDLSEQYVLSCLPAAGSCNGGNTTKCVFYFINSTSSDGNYHYGVITYENTSIS